MALILASASPRRAGLLRQIGLSFETAPGHAEEGRPYRPWTSWLKETARAKALEAVERANPGDVILAADTIVVCEDIVLGKPEDEEDAVRMLSFLSGKSHEVLTGVCLAHLAAGKKEQLRCYQDVETTRVYFRKLEKSEIYAYVKNGEPLDKAGAYGIQGLGALLVEKIEGCYFNVVGLPLVKTMNLLRHCGIDVLGE